jgi:inner membrane transporter RhtA
LAQAGASLFNPSLLPIAISVAVLSSALPYTLEMSALTRLPRSTFGTLMSLEPAIAALAGWIMLGQHLTLRQDLAITAIIVASGGAAFSFVSAKPAIQV